VQVAENHLALVGVADADPEQPGGEFHRIDSSPFQRRISASREALSERTAAGVTEK
jgi:hypothetical protein